jgi:hypothetical protein
MDAEVIGTRATSLPWNLQSVEMALSFADGLPAVRKSISSL